MNIAGKTLLVTGANHALGEALVNEALNRGTKLLRRSTGRSMRLANLDVLINDAGLAIYCPIWA